MLQLAATLADPTVGQRLTAAWHTFQRAISMTANTMGTNLFAVGVAIFLFVAIVLRKAMKQGSAAVKADLVGEARFSLLLGGAVWLLVLFWNTAVVIHDDHRRFVAQVAALTLEKEALRNQLDASTTEVGKTFEAQLNEVRRKNAALQAELFDRTHNISTQTPAFSNINGLTNAFRSWRATIGPTTPCRVEITAPPDARDMALTVGQLSVIGSNCPTFGPSDWNIDPDEETRAKVGMVPKTVVVHIAKGVRGDVSLFDQLQNLFLVKRSYDVPPGSPDNFVWLQFGPGAKWNSQLQN